MSEGDAVANGKAKVPGKPGTGRQKCSSVPVESRICGESITREKTDYEWFCMCIGTKKSGGVKKVS